MCSLAKLNNLWCLSFQFIKWGDSIGFPKPLSQGFKGAEVSKELSVLCAGGIYQAHILPSGPPCGEGVYCWGGRALSESAPCFSSLK